MAGDTSVASAPLHKVGATEAQGQVYVFGPAPAPAAQGGGSPGGGGGGPSAAPSTTLSATPPGSSATATAPALTRVKQSARVWRAGRKLRAHRAQPAAPGGHDVLVHARPGRDRALRFSGKGRRARGGTLTLRGHQGTDTVAFAGRLSRRRALRPGGWTVRITATNAAGQRRPRGRCGFRNVRSRAGQPGAALTRPRLAGRRGSRGPRRRRGSPRGGRACPGTAASASRPASSSST